MEHQVPPALHLPRVRKTASVVDSSRSSFGTNSRSVEFLPDVVNLVVQFVHGTAKFIHPLVTPPGRIHLTLGVLPPLFPARHKILVPAPPILITSRATNPLFDPNATTLLPPKPSLGRPIITTDFATKAGLTDFDKIVPVRQFPRDGLFLDVPEDTI